jgi:hypothetical protein
VLLYPPLSIASSRRVAPELIFVLRFVRNDRSSRVWNLTWNKIGDPLAAVEIIRNRGFPGHRRRDPWLDRAIDLCAS